MATCTTAGCPCKNLYTDWDIGHRGGNCEDCGHWKTNHLRQAPAASGTQVIILCPNTYYPCCELLNFIEQLHRINFYFTYYLILLYSHLFVLKFIAFYN
jgi:hypothetical protein